MQKIINLINKTKFILVFLAFIMINIFYSLPAEAADDLSNVMTSVQSDFGTGSTFIKIMYLLEIIAAVYGYHKTKNIGVLAGIVIISIFLNFALGHWVFGQQ